MPGGQCSRGWQVEQIGEDDRRESGGSFLCSSRSSSNRAVKLRLSSRDVTGGTAFSILKERWYALYTWLTYGFVTTM